MVGIVVLGYLVYALVGARGTFAELGTFLWPIYVPVLVLTLVNYGLRFFKWHYLLGRLGVKLPVLPNLMVFITGLAMVISPGKAGELLKPYLVREITGTPMMRTIPALATERITDGIAVVALAAVGVTTFYAEATWLVGATILAIVGGLGVLAIEPLSLGIIETIGRTPIIGRFAPALETAYRSLRICTAPVPLTITVGVSLVAWWAECMGYWLIFRGLSVEAGLDVSTFLYAFATLFGAPSPGGVGMADGALVGGAIGLIEGLTHSQSLAAALLVRIATLWFGVLIGAIAMLRMETIISYGRRTFRGVA